MLALTQLIRRPGRNRVHPAIKTAVTPEQLTQQILDQLTREPLKNLNVRLWNGSLWPDDQPKAAMLVLKRPSALREILLADSEAAVGEAYLDNAFDVEGNMEAAFELADHLMESTQGWTRKLEIAYLLKKLPESPICSCDDSRHLPTRGSKHSVRRDHEAIQFHYNVSNDFYALWLDKQMAYSCAYFKDPSEDLEEAQQNKFDLICRKLGLRSGQRLLDIGCGWGGLVLHAAEHYRVHAVGVTLSEQQLQYAQEAVQRRGLERQIRLHLHDYRELRELEQYDAISSVGMVEHVGRENLSVYFRKARHLLKPGGLFLNHGIGLGPVPFPGKSGSFIQQHVFPDSDLVSINDMLQPAENAGWEIRDVECLREHYAQTLRHWVQRLEAAHDQALSFVSESTYRIWRLYMSGCAHNFQTGRLSIYQSLLAKVDPKGASRAPSVRSMWYS